MSVRQFGLVALLLGSIPTAWSQSRPPTLDPTYGRSMPHRVSSKTTMSPDAHWIWAATTQDNQTIHVRHELKLDHVRSVKAFVTADNFFTLYVNGQKVGGTAPIPGEDLGWAKVQAFDLTPFVKAGVNEIAIEGVNAGSAAGVLARIQADGKPVLITDGTWKVQDGPTPDNWYGADFNDSAWAAARDLGPAPMDPWGGQLEGWPVPLDALPDYLFRMPLNPVQVSYAPDIDHVNWQPASSSIHMARPAGEGAWSLIVDFGKELTGRVMVSKYKGDLQIGTGESIGEAIEKPWKTSSTATSPYSAFRYAVLKFPAGTQAFDGDVVLDHLYYPVQYKGSFDCSDPLLTQIWYTGAYTAHLCMQQDIWDAPKRDRARWMGDLHVSGEVINNVFADKFLMEQTISRLREDAQGGKPASEQPNSNVNGIPGYSCAWISGLADLYRHIGDKEYIESQHQALLTLIDYLHGELNSDGVFANKHGQWPYVDWAPEFNGDHPLARVATQLFMVKAAHEAEFLLTSLGDTANAAKCAQWATDLTAAAQAHMRDANGIFGDRRQANSMAIYSGAATPAETAAIYDKVLNPASPAWKIQATPYYNNYVIFAQSLSGHTQDAVDFIRSYWGGMLAEGATSWWEGYDLSWDKNNSHIHLQADDGTGYFVSLCHGWSAGPTNLLTERVLGVRPTGAGFSTCEIAPELGDLKWVSGTVPTPQGGLKVKVEKGSIHVTIPAGVSATVTPGGQISKVDWRTGSGSSVVLGPGTHTVVSTVAG